MDRPKKYGKPSGHLEEMKVNHLVTSSELDGTNVSVGCKVFVVFH